MDDMRLAELYRRALARTGAAAPAADDLVALAAGRHLGDRHDAVLAALAATPDALALHRVAQAAAQPAAALAGELEALSRRAEPRPQRSFGPPCSQLADPSRPENSASSTTPRTEGWRTAASSWPSEPESRSRSRAAGLAKAKRRAAKSSFEVPLTSITGSGRISSMS